MISLQVENLSVDDFIEILSVRKFDGGLKEFEEFVRLFFDQYETSKRENIRLQLEDEVRNAKIKLMVSDKKELEVICDQIDEIVLEREIFLTKIWYSRNKNKKKNADDTSS